MKGLNLLSKLNNWGWGMLLWFVVRILLIIMVEFWLWWVIFWWFKLIWLFNWWINIIFKNWCVFWEFCIRKILLDLVVLCVMMMGSLWELLSIRMCFLFSWILMKLIWVFMFLIISWCLSCLVDWLMRISKVNIILLIVWLFFWKWVIWLMYFLCLRSVKCKVLIILWS